VHFTHNLTQLRPLMKKVIDLLDLIQDVEGLFADRLAKPGAGARPSTGVRVYDVAARTGRTGAGKTLLARALPRSLLAARSQLRPPAS
jgi:hypothetical protein